ncbi:MAG TPA: ATP-binding protein [Gemmatimonadaceae bacterium]|nr:ATP-binding protein [Gemmatimonadaceae bacterium]
MPSRELPPLDYRAIFNGGATPYMILDVDAPRYTILGASDAYLAATGRTREDIVGKAIFEAFPNNPAEDVDSESIVRGALDRVRTTLKPDYLPIVKYDVPRSAAEGGGFKVKYWSPVHSPVFDENGTLVHIAQRVDDVTELHDAHERLKELDRHKTQFFSNVSHEFRTPLALMLTPLEELLAAATGILEPEVRSSLEVVHRNALRLLKLVNALLDFSRLEAGRASARVQPLDLAALTRELAASFESALERAGIEFIRRLEPLPAAVHVDPEMWEKIVLNLISNAFKFTLEGEIEVALEWKGDTVELSVRDTGCGIPAAELPRMFERFHQVAGTHGRSFEGSGIGLSLVREFASLHGGVARVESVEGEGSTFSVTIPTTIAAPDAAAPDAVAGRARTGRESYAMDAREWVDDASEHSGAAERTPPAEHVVRERVLVADDNADMRRLLSRILSERWDVEVTANGRAALESAALRPPDIVVSDVMMPELDGFGLLNALRASPATREIPVVLVSARAGEESLLEGIETGADDYLVKPFSKRELVARVRVHLELARMRRQWSGDLARVNAELESFSYSVSHDLRAPLRAVDGFSHAIEEDHGPSLPEDAREGLARVRAAAARMNQLIDDLLALARLSRIPLERSRVDVSSVAREIVGDLRAREPEREVAVVIAEGLTVNGDARLVRVLLENLIGNAWKFSAKREDARIEIGRGAASGHPDAIFVRDNGDGFDMRHAARLFTPFQRLHTAEEFEGTGIGLATVQRVAHRHGGRIWAEAEKGRGATFLFTLQPPAHPLV